MFEAVRDDAEGEGLNSGKGGGPGPAIGKGTRDGTDLTDPPAVLFPIELDAKPHAPKITRDLRGSAVLVRSRPVVSF